MVTKDRPTKRAKMLSASSDDSDSDNAGVPLPAETGFRINEAYARRFEHNKKREERQHLEEKYAANEHKRKRGAADGSEDVEDTEDGDSSSSDAETEDSDAALATAELDQEIDSTLQAIRRKDPRVYDPEARFYRAFDVEEAAGRREGNEARPMYLRDYHRENLLAGHTGAEAEGEEGEGTYVREQEKLKREVVGSMHAAAAATANDDDDEDDFLIAKPPPVRAKADEELLPIKPIITPADIASAANDPDTYLSNFMAARAWVPPEGSHSYHAPLPEEEDDSNDEHRAEAFEHAYNMRFEDPTTANETLRTFARDVAAGHSVRRDTTTGGRRAKREREKMEKERARREREEEKARLRRLRIEELEGKVARIREVAGLGAGEVVDVEAWREVLDGAEWEEGAWERLVEEKVFGEGYYGSAEVEKGKPRWEDEIGIEDLVPGFQEREEAGGEDLADEGRQEGVDGGSLSNYVDEDEEEGEGDEDGDVDMDVDHPTGSHHIPKKRSKKISTKKSREQERATARRQRRQIEKLIDSTLPDTPTTTTTGFRYRPTSPTSFGLTTRDILFASDAQLNAFAGLKKLAPFRAEEKKRRDRKRLGKKGRVREWRWETFGKEEEPRIEEEPKREEEGVEAKAEEGAEKRKKKKRRRGKGVREGEKN